MTHTTVRRKRLRGIFLVFIGGALGTGLRGILTTCTPDGAAIWIVLAINIIGAALLGALLETLAAGPELSARRQELRLLLGTGCLGGFTTYSTFAVDAAELIGANQFSLAICYLVASLVCGLAAAAGAIAVVRAVRRSR